LKEYISAATLEWYCNEYKEDADLFKNPDDICNESLNQFSKEISVPDDGSSFAGDIIRLNLGLDVTKE